MFAYGVHDAHYPVGRDDTGLFLDAVFESAVEDEIVMLLVAAHFHHLGRHHGKAGPVQGVQAFDVRFPHALPGQLQFLHQAEVLIREFPIRGGE